MKTVRFAQVLARAGKPQQHLTWVAPDKDPELARAAKTHRLLTLHQTLRGGKKDYGTVGLHTGDHAQFLIFPKSLKAFTDRRVIAVDYAAFAGELSSSATLATPPRRKLAKAPKTAKAAQKAPPPKPAPPAAVPPPQAKAKATPPAKRPTPPARVKPAPRKPAPTPAPPPKKKTPRSEIEHALAELKAHQPQAARRRLQRWLKTFGTGHGAS